MIRTRIAPSPTGHFHIGNARTALFNYLFAKKHGGAFVLRIEDTDIERSDKAFETDIFESLDWLGIKADESPAKGGPYTPYRQSERTASYRQYLKKLLAEKKAFRCPHTKEGLDAEHKSLMKEKKWPVHRCSARESQISDGIIRFKVPPISPIPPRDSDKVKYPEPEKWVAFTDYIRKGVVALLDSIEDFAIAKDINTPLYNFAVVIDDYEMKISHVIRGEDHISNTPKQMLIQEALGLPTPAYAHLPLILGPDRSKLSKRHGATAIREFRRQGYLPEALANFAALLGWNPGGEREIFTMEELVRYFDLGKVQKAGAVFNVEKLDWMNGEYIRKKSVAELAELCRPHLKNFLQIPVSKSKFPNEYVEQVVALEQPRLKKLSEIGERSDFFFRPPEYPAELLRWKQMTDPEIRASLERSRTIIAGIAEEKFTPEKLHARFFAEIGAGDRGVILWPLRVALSGKAASPGPFEIMAILGKQESQRRIETAIEKTGRN